MKNNKNIIIIVGIILLFIGTLLPSIKIAQENISFLKDNGPLIIILTAIMFIILKLEKTKLIIAPATLSLIVILKFIITNISRINEISEKYNCYAKFKYGLIIMLLGNIIIITTTLIETINIKNIKEKIIQIKKATRKNKLEKLKTKKENKQNKLNSKTLTPTLIEKLSKKENKKTITNETTKDGKIKYKKIVVKVDNKEKTTLKQKLNNLILKIKLKKVNKKNLSISKYKEQQKHTRTYHIPSIDIRKWTRNNVSCINCGATIKSNSEYCFLCDCKINLQEKNEKLS